MSEQKYRVKIRIAGNTEAPALLVLRAKGYRLWVEYTKHGDSSGLCDADYQA